MKVKLPQKFIDENKHKGLELFLQGLGNNDTMDKTCLIVCGYLQDKDKILEYEHQWWTPTTQIITLQLNGYYVTIPEKKIKEMNFKKNHLNNPFSDRIYIWDANYMQKMLEKEKKMSQEEKDKRYQTVMQEFQKAGIKLPF